jgi:hypothetical protein
MALSLLDAFRARRSIRSFQPGPLDPDKVAVVEEALRIGNALEVPFGTASFLGLHPPGLGRNIKNEAGWIIGKIPSGFPADQKQKIFIDLAVRLQYASMILAQNGVPTIWIIGTFVSGPAIAANPGFDVPAGLAYGLVPNDKYLKPKDTWQTARKPLEQLFFDVATGQPIGGTTAGANIDLLQALRSGPTGMNKQPWRFGIDAAQIHIYNAVGTEFTWWDIGIGAGNVAYFLNAKGVKPVYSVVANPPPSPIEGEYVLSLNLA